MTHELGKVGLAENLEVSQIGFGAMALSHVYGEPKPGSVGPAGTNEELVGSVVGKRRDEVQLATKFGITGGLGKNATGETRRTAGDRDYVRAACEASLRRLGVDHIDLYYMHRRELDRPIEETVAAMGELVDEGKVRYLGLSEVTAAEVRAASATYPIAAVQSEWSIWSRDVEASVVPTCAEFEIGFVPYSPLGRGFLTGTMSREKVQSGMWKGQPRFDDNFEANQQVVDVVRSVADELGATPAQVALAWLLAKGEQLGLPVVPIPGTRSPQRLDENAAAANLQLDEAQMNQLDAAGALTQGDRNLTFNSPDWISANRE